MGIGQEMTANNKARLKLMNGLFQMCAGGREREKNEEEQTRDYRKPGRRRPVPEKRNSLEDPTVSFHNSSISNMGLYGLFSM